jgi:hypothetical protein
MSLPLALLLAGAIIAGCAADGRDLPAPPDPGPSPGRTAAPAVCGATPDDSLQEHWVRFDVTREQWDTIGRHLVDVLCRQGLWQQGVRFGMNSNQERTRFWVLIDPGRSGLSARQILDRLLGR